MCGFANWLHLTLLLSAVCLAVWRNHHMRTVTNYFIVNLSLADVLVTAICLPASLLVDITESWLFGQALCKVIPYLQVSSPMALSTLYHICPKPMTLVAFSNFIVCLSVKLHWLRTLVGLFKPPGWTVGNTDTARHTHIDKLDHTHTETHTHTQTHTQSYFRVHRHMQRRDRSPQ